MTEITSQQTLIAVLCDPQRNLLGAPVEQVVETHISWVLLTGEQAYKIKKAVNFGFLDFTALEQRHFYCKEELRLNRRLAPQLYLDVISIGGTPEQPAIGVQPAIEYAVKMQRFPDGMLLDQLLTRGELTPQHLDALAHTMAEFHRSLPPAAADTAFGTPAAIHADALQNFEQTLQLLHDETDREQLATIQGLTEDEFRRCDPIFAARRHQGHVRECHGDLHFGNIVLLDGAPVPFDGIEFNPEFRWLDTINDIAFLVMDLLHRQQPALAYRFLNTYMEQSGDYEGIAVLRFYLAYRAMVRAKVSAIRASQPEQSVDARSKEMRDCRNHLALALQCLMQRKAALIITHGLPGSGKSTFAQQALERYGAIRIRSDVERKRLYPSAENRYSTQATERTYARLHELSRIILAAGYPVIVDAAFIKHDEREQFYRLAQEMKVPFAIASLQADTATLQQRVAQRSAQGKDASEADVAILNLLLEKQELLSLEEQRYTATFSEQQDGWDDLQRLLGA